MGRGKRQKENTASTHSPLTTNISNITALIILIALNFVSGIGGILLWLFLWPIRFRKINFSFFEARFKKLLTFPKKEKKKRKEAKDFFLQIKNLLQALFSFKSLVRNFLAKILLFFPKLLAKAKPKAPPFKKSGQIYPRVGFFTKIKFFLLGIIITIFFVVVPLTLYFWLAELPNPKLLSSREIPLTTKIYDRNKTLLYQIYSSQNRSFVKLSEIPENLINATVSIEDQNFYRHRGVDVKGILRAGFVNFTNGKNKEGKPLQGGSSITQQLIKSALLSPEQTIQRKIKEVVLALWAETIYSKEEILEMYFNQVPYGGTAWGVGAAAETYFKKKVSDLNLAESALLAGLPAAPSIYSPFGAHPELAKERQKEVLRRMREDGYLTPEQERVTGEEQMKFAQPNIEIRAPHFVMYVKELLARKYGLRLVEQGGLNVYTSLDLKTQDMVQEKVSAEIGKLKYLLVGNGAALVTNPKNGEILAMVGSQDFFDLENDGNVNVTLAHRQPGSSIKPIMYAAALQRGYTPSTIIDDSAISFNIPGQRPYTPVNYDGKFHGKVTLRQALGNSLNIPAVKVLNNIGVKTMIEMGRKMGISTWEDENRFGLSLTLGGGEVTMVDMAEAFGIFANEGKKQPLNPIIKITDYKGSIIEEEKSDSRSRVLPQEVAFQISSMLSDNSARTMAFGPSSALVVPGKTVAVKTGTTNEKRDNWTIGYTPSVLVAVWVGNNDNSPMHPYLSSGITGAAPIWHNIMVELLKDKEEEKFAQSGELIPVQVCAWNGMLPCEGCPTITEYFIKGSEPKIHCRKITPSPTP